MKILMLRHCVYPGCEVLTLGAFCVHHEPAVKPRRFPRGRPYMLTEREPAGIGLPPRIDIPLSVEGNLAGRAVSLPGGS